MINLLAQAAEDGFIERNHDVLDIFLLIATILFVIAFIVRVMVRPIAIDLVCIAAGLAATTFALLFL